ncbi:MAG: solute-binding protein [Chloroflexaceae bacterium]|nr:solute-binding protein [Chloroflexaceae bacterium]
MTHRALHARAIARVGLLISMLLLAACADSSAPTARDEPLRIRVSGAFALFPMMTVWAEAYTAQNPNITFDVQAGGAGKGMSDVLSGVADIAMLSRDVRQEELEQGAFLVPVAIDAVVGTVNADNPVLEDLLAQGITPEIASKIWISGEITTWGEVVGTADATLINVYTRSDASGAAEVWSQFLGGTSQEDLQGIAVNADPGLAQAVIQDANGIGYNNIAFAYSLATDAQTDGLRVIPIDLDGDGRISPAEDFYTSRLAINAAVGAQIYPYPPARLLYVVTKGTPSPVLADFFHWILTDGQPLVNEAGFVGLNEQMIQAGLDVLP